MTRPGEEQADTTKWLLGLLRTSGFRVGDHGIPPGEGFPFLVVRSIPGGSVTGPPLWDPAADQAFVFQVDAVGETREQAQRLAGRARRLIVGRDPQSGAYVATPPDPSGFKIHDRMPEGTPPGVEVGGAAPREVYTVPERYVLSTTPTP